MKFYIDENLMPAIADSLTGIYRGHTFRTPQQEHLLGLEDLELFPDLAQRGFDCIITEDKAQLDRPAERAGLAEAGLHWVGILKLRNVRGVAQLASQVSMVAGGLGWVIGDAPEAPTAYRLKGPRTYDNLKPDAEPL